MSVRRIATLFSFFWRIILISFRDAFHAIVPDKPKLVYEDVVLITGGGRGIGRTVALKIAKHRPKHIILCGRTESSLLETSREIQKLNVNCAFMICDVSSKEQVYAMAKEVEAKFGPVTILINNAGIVQPNSVLEASAEDITHTLKTNTLSHFWTIRAFLPGMLEVGHGHIVSINSMLGWAALNGAVDYCASKFASSGLHDALKDELSVLKHNGIHLTSVYPYQVDNTMFAGISVRFPRVFPTVKEDILGEKIVEGILTNRSIILMPKMMYAVACFYSIAPTKAITAVMKFLHVHKAVDQYKDHRKKNGLHR